MIGPSNPLPTPIALYKDKYCGSASSCSVAFYVKFLAPSDTKRRTEGAREREGQQRWPVGHGS
jgi:hypothetical protein